MKTIALLSSLAMLLNCQSLFAEEMFPEEDDSKLSLKAIFSSKEFKDENFSRPHWWNEGSNYTTLERLDPESRVSGCGCGCGA